LGFLGFDIHSFYADPLPQEKFAAYPAGDCKDSAPAICLACQQYIPGTTIRNVD